MNTFDPALFENVRIIDISQPIESASACFPGDTPFSRQVTVSFEESGLINLSALTMSPHVGTHVDAPVHVRGTMKGQKEAVGNLPLNPFIGPATVVDISPFTGAITAHDLESRISDFTPRLLIRTRHQMRYHVFENDYAYFHPELAGWFKEKNICLAGLDTPSVDETTSKTLTAHHQLLSHNIYWLENLDLSQARSGKYVLVAMPLKFMELEASPVRAILLDWSEVSK